MEDENQEVELPNQEVITKYKEAAEIANRTLAEVVKACTPGKTIVEICTLGDQLINESVAKIFTKGKMDKGVAFPTSISVNNCVGHYSPLAEDTATLKDGDITKIDLGVQIDGYIALVAHTIVVTSTPESPITGKKADLICAAHYAAEIAHRLIKPGNKVTEAINKVANQFECQVMEGVLSHQMKRFVIDGNNVIISKASLEHKVDEFEFEENQAYAVDIVMSSGEGKAKELETRTTIFKRSVDQNYQLKLKAARYVLNEVNARFPTFPFTLRAFDEKRSRLGITEMLNHEMVVPYPVLYEKEGVDVAQFKFTVLILSSGTLRITSHPLPYVSSSHKIEDPELNAILATGTKRNKKSKKKNTKKKTEGEGQPMDTTEK